MISRGVTRDHVSAEKKDRAKKLNPDRRCSSPAIIIDGTPLMRSAHRSKHTLLRRIRLNKKRGMTETFTVLVQAATLVASDDSIFWLAQTLLGGRRALANDTIVCCVGISCVRLARFGGHVKTVPLRNTRSNTFRVCPLGSCHPRLSRKLLTCVLLVVVSCPSLLQQTWSPSPLVSMANTPPAGLPWLTDRWHRASGRGGQRHAVHEL
jgi:hypothetical protein